jgi:hypothetical protein
MKNYIFLLIPLCLAFLPTQVLGNCARPTNYYITVENNTVAVAPLNFQKRTCPDASGMLRQNIATGETVKLADYCATTGKDGPFKYSSETSSYLDECVPAGKYRYGFAKPYECCSSCCGTLLYGEAEVTTLLTTDCRRATGNHEPVATANMPWSHTSMICDYTNMNQLHDGGAPDSTVPIDTKLASNDVSNDSVQSIIDATAQVDANPQVTDSSSNIDTVAQANPTLTDAALSTDLDAHTTVTTPASSLKPSASSSGCSMGGAAGGVAAIGIHGLAFLVGLVWLRRRRVNR